MIKVVCFLSLKWKMHHRIDNIGVGHFFFFQFHKLGAHRLHVVLFISVTFNKIMAMEGIKLTQNVHNETLSAVVSGTIQSAYSEWHIKETKAIFSLLLLMYRNAWI